MSRSLALGVRSRASGVLVCGLALVPMAGCHQRSSIMGRPSSPEKTETVNVGYGEQSREQTGGVVESATAEHMQNRKVRRVEELLMGRFPGVHVLPTPAGGFSIRIRSASNGEPLYIVDGMPVEVTPGRRLDWLDPADIASIDVLKNPAETSMYGGRGANGVILIKTKVSRSR